MSIRHCVIPAAGLGTRFLPATKALPKELLPVLDRPVLQWAVEEAVAAGCDHMVVVTSRGKELMAAHFDAAPELERSLAEHGRAEALEVVERTCRLAGFSYVYQAERLGLGHAVLQAAPVVTGHTVACMLPDDLSWGGTPVLRQLVDAHAQTGTTVLALMRCPADTISRYGVATIAESHGRLHRVSGMVEKPPAGEAPSDLAIMGRYVLTPAVFESLRSTPRGAGREIQLTDGIGRTLAGHEVWGVEFEGELLDVGTPQGWLRTLIRLAHSDPTFGPVLREAIKALPVEVGR